MRNIEKNVPCSKGPMAQLKQQLLVLSLITCAAILTSQSALGQAVKFEALRQPFLEVSRF